MKLKNQNGFAFVFVMLYLSVAFTGFQSFATLSGSHLIGGDLMVKSSQAFYLAEAATEDAKARLRDDFSTFPVSGEGSIISLGLGEYYFNVTQTANLDERRITAYGAVPDFATAQATEIVEVVVKDIPPSLFDYALYSSGNIKMDHSAEVTGEVMGGIDLKMEASATVNGNITVGNDVELEDSAAVNGDITAGGSISCQGSSCGLVSGTQTENANVTFTEPTFDLNELRTVAQGQTYNGHDNYYLASEINSGNPPFPTTFYETPPSGGDPGVPWVIFVEGNLKLEDSAVAGGFIVVNGKAEFWSSMELHGVLYTTTNRVEMESSAIVDGSVITTNGATTNFESSTKITWNKAYADAIKAQSYSQSSGAGGEELSQLSWNEKAN